MLRKWARIVAVIAVVFGGVAPLGAADENGGQKSEGKQVKQSASSGYLYTINNDLKMNGVAVYRQGDGGALTEVSGSPFPAGGKGLTGGDVEEQGAIRVHGEFVLAVNPGSDSVAVLRKGKGGMLMPVPGSPFYSGGSTPLSVAAHGDLVYVANQAAPFAKPKSTVPNITGFRMSKDGTLKEIEKSQITFKEGYGPTQVEFSADGKVLVATSGFQGEKSSRIHAYKVIKDGMLKEGPGSSAEPKNASGTIGFSLDPRGNRAYVSAFRGSAVIVFDVDSKTAGLKQLGEPYGDKETAACWTAIAPDGKTLYVANFVSNSISVFDIHPDGKLSLLGTTKRRAGNSPDTKDLEVSRDGRFLYAIGTGQREIAIFRIGEDRMLTELPEGQSPVKLITGQHTTGLVAD